MISFVFMLYCITLHYIWLYYIISYNIIYHIISYHTITHRIILYHIIYHVISCHILYYIILYYIILYYIILYYIILYYIILYYASHNVNKLWYIQIPLPGKCKLWLPDSLQNLSLCMPCYYKWHEFISGELKTIDRLVVHQTSVVFPAATR